MNVLLERLTGAAARRHWVVIIAWVRPGRRPRGDKRKGVTETHYARLFDAAHQLSSAGRSWPSGTT